ncbi:galactose-specific lectin nattectin-like [Branchiostoma floridae x Branchiostoma japonicum]
MSDSCRPGYKLLTSTCVRLGSRKMTYWNAKSACKKEGATLAMPKTAELDLALRSLVRTEGQNRTHWIGLKNKWRFRLRERRWKWEDGSRLSNYKGWNPGQPDNRGWHHWCVNYFTGPTGYPMWNDRMCETKHGFICQQSFA